MAGRLIASELVFVSVEEESVSRLGVPLRLSLMTGTGDRRLVTISAKARWHIVVG
jgi:hypothetical protein